MVLCPACIAVACQILCPLGFCPLGLPHRVLLQTERITIPPLDMFQGKRAAVATSVLQVDCEFTIRVVHAAAAELDLARLAGTDRKRTAAQRWALCEADGGAASWTLCAQSGADMGAASLRCRL